MKTAKVEITLPTKNTAWRLISFSDLHYGSRACDEQQAREDIASIKDDPQAFVVCGGDLAEAIVFDDPRYEPDLHDLIEPSDYARKSCDKVIKLLEPIAGKILFGITGNHESKFHQKHFFDMAAYVYGHLGVPYLGYSGLVYVAVRTQAKRGKETAYGVRVFIHHGVGGWQMKGAKVNRIMQFGMAQDADVFIMCHVHDMYAGAEPIIGVKSTGEMTSKSRGYIVGGTYYKTYMDGSTTYAEKKGFRPSVIGSPYLGIRQDKYGNLEMNGFRYQR